MFKSERTTSGISRRISNKAVKPSAADRTLYSKSVKMCDSDIRVDGSSSTIRSFTFAWGTVHLPQGFIHKIFGELSHCAQSRTVQFCSQCSFARGRLCFIPPRHLREKHLRHFAQVIDREKLTRDRVVPIISAKVSCVILGINVSGSPGLPNSAINKRILAKRFSLELKS